MDAPVPITVGGLGRPSAPRLLRRLDPRATSLRHRLVRATALGVASVLAASLLDASVPGLSTPTQGHAVRAALAIAAGVGQGRVPSAASARRPDPGMAAAGAGADEPLVPLGPPAAVVYRVRTREKVVALTFDDGWSPKAGRQILDTLLWLHVPATFFVNAMYVRWDPGLWRDIAAAGFPIGNHTYDHRNLTKLTSAEIVADIRRDDATFLRLTGYAMAPIFRPPYGARNPAVDAAVLEAGCPTEVLWNVVGGDTAAGITDAREIANASAGRPGSIVLLHVGPASTPRVLAAIIARYEARGFRFVTVPELLALR